MTGDTDSLARGKALDTRRSFIVQAPAGSGKTELLIQRYLMLLQTVDEPEQVVAITFTRKAAAEMRGRVLAALESAAETAPALPPHRAATAAIARSVLERDRRLQWSLASNPQRIRIDTLDAMNAWLARQLPVLSGGVAGANLIDDATLLYRQAAARTVERVSERSELGGAVRSLLGAVGNSVERLENLLAALLPSRDQWLRHLAIGSLQDLQMEIGRGLAALVGDHLRLLHRTLGPADRAEIADLLDHAARHATRADSVRIFAAWDRSVDLSGDSSAALAAWRAVAHLLQSATGEWRRQLTKHQGFGPDHADARRRLAALIAAVQGNAALRGALRDLQHLPEPEYTADQWRDLKLLRALLPQTVAELRVVFAEQETVDFVELAIAAENALGRVDEPSELLLAIDRRIQHLLVDEFQDTSHAQLRLLELLTAGWSPEDGRTLFLVGDPMQSIYRFRDADMSLFLRAKRRGIGPVRLEPLVLERNFRSAPAIVEWVNQAFAGIFPSSDDPERGAAGFRASLAARAGGERGSIRMHTLRSDDPDEEIRRTVEIVEHERSSRPSSSIAVLVQSRAHLRDLRSRLRARGITARAVEIDAPAETEIVQDLLGLTRALAHLGDRIAWLAVLRAPWCGLRWADLHALCAGADEATVWEMLHDRQRIAGLSADGQARLRAARSVLESARRLRGQHSFSGWIEHAWKMLDGPSCLHGQEDFDRAAQFFGDLGHLSRYGDLDDPAQLESHFLKPVEQPDPGAHAGLEIMTIHRAKGLEFDTVILLGLGKRVRGPEARALHWQERWNDDGSTTLLIAPLARGPNALSAYLHRLEQQRDQAERGRLLYVASTRASNRLHLVAQLPTTQHEPQRGTFLELLWPAIATEFAAAEAAPAAPPVARVAIRPPLYRLADGFELRDADAVPESLPEPDGREPRPEFAWAGQAAVQVGTIVHRELQRITETGIEGWDGSAIDGRMARYRRELEMLGVVREELDDSVRRVCAALRRVLADRRGRWILTDQREAGSELRVTVDGSRLEHLRLDRTFVDENGTRWIIDYKTSSHEGGDVAKFLDSEVERYRAQLERYAAAMAATDSRPIRVGLYFPLLGEFRDWEPAESALAGPR